VKTEGDGVRLDLTDCSVDALEAARTVQDVAEADVDRLKTIAASFAGDLAEGLELENHPAFHGWLTGQRHRFRGYHTAVLERLAGEVADDEIFAYLQRWVDLAPFDPGVHERLLRTLARCDRIREGEEHVAAALRLFEAEGLDGSPIREAWRTARERELVVVTEAPAPAAELARSRRASLAVMPFVDSSPLGTVRGGAADALAHDVITKLAKLRSVFIIAQGTVFALHEQNVGPHEAGRKLGVDYVASGAVHLRAGRVEVAVELAEVRTARLIWAETFDDELDETFTILDAIADSIVASIASEIETNERNRALLRPPSSLDAWEAHHRGLWHMYRFTRLDNARARAFFERAVALDPAFARAYAGLSFTYFQNAFQGWERDEWVIARALETAEHSLMADDHDPSAHWAMGRALWLRGRNDQSIAELTQAIELSPNFALGHYTLAFVHAQAGDPHAAVVSADRSRRLSPFDPLLFGMLGARAMALVRMGRFEEAAGWAIQAAARPNAHPHILAIAGLTLALAGRLDEARAYFATIRRLLPRYSIDDFLTAMHFDRDGEALFRDAARRIGLA
jgi:TolB-like protein/Tfp pilus assembly protein PilF